jgi:hypothetical protein
LASSGCTIAEPNNTRTAAGSRSGFVERMMWQVQDELLQFENIHIARRKQTAR